MSKKVVTEGEMFTKTKSIENGIGAIWEVDGKEGIPFEIRKAGGLKVLLSYPTSDQDILLDIFGLLALKNVIEFFLNKYYEGVFSEMEEVKE